MSVQNRTLRSAVRLALMTSAMTAMAASAVAQESAPATEAISEVVVTGSRIARPDYTAPSPIVSVGSEVFNRVAAATPDQVLNTLPQFVPNITANNNNPGNGQANIDLRGLGTNRNLVLLNGRRLPASNADGTVDVNIIPTALLRSVEVLTGGASATYGSDAIAGVTNFILRDDFEGVELESTYGVTAEDDGEEWTANITMGGNFADDRGNAVVFLGYSEREAVRQGDREFSFLDLDVRRDGNTPGGSGTFPEGRILSDSENLADQAVIDQVFGAYGGYTPGAVTPSRALGTNPDGTLFSAGNGTPGSVVNFRGEMDASFNPDSYAYNFAPPNMLQLPLERWNLAAFLNYDLTDNVNAYFQAIYTDYGADTNLAPTPATGLTVPVTNPFIPDDLRTIMASRPDNTAPFGFSRRMEEVGPRTDVFDVKVWQFTTGLKGEFGDGYNWDVYVSGSRMDERNTQGGDLSLERIQELLEAPDGGASICAGGFNPFGKGKVSPECAEYVSSYFTNITIVEQISAEATLSGRMFSMPAGDAQFAVGAAYREDSYDFEPDSAVATGDLVGFNQQNPLSGSINATELFAEALLPIVRDAPLAQRLDLSLGYRWSDYNLSGSANAYKAELDWQMIDSVRFRTSYQRAVRAPSIDELFSPPDQDFPPVIEDPCDITSTARTAGPNADAVNGGSDAIRQLCLQTGVGADVIDDYGYPFAQVETTAGGNPNLQEETADTITFGVVFDSPFSGAFENFRASIDYWSIEIDDAIIVLPGGEILLMCYGANGNNPNFDPADPACAVVDRSVYGDSSPVISAGLTSNASKLETAGIDVQLDWGLDFGTPGRLATNLVYSYLDKYDVSPRAGLPTLDRVGQVSDTPGETLPEYKLLLNLDYYFLSDQFRLGARYRYIPAMDNKYINYDNITTVGTPSIDYLDLNASWYVTEAAEISIGAINVTDEEPPLYTASIEMNTDPSTFDVLGRRYFARLNYKF